MKTILRLLPYIKPYKTHLIYSAVCNLLLAFFTLFTIPAFIPFFQILFGNSNDALANSGKLLNSVRAFFQSTIQIHGKPTALIYICVFLVTVLFLKNLFRYLALYAMGPMRTGVIRDIREKLYSKFLHLPLSYFSNERKGDLMSRITNDVMEIEWSVITTIEAFFREPLILLGSLAFMIYVSPQLTAIVIALMFFIGVIIGGASRRLKKQSQEAQDQLGLVNSTLEESFGGMRIIKSFTAENYMIETFKNENNRYRSLSWAMLKRRDLSNPLSEFLGVTAVVTLLYIGSRQVFAQHLSPEVFLTFIFAFYSVIDPSKSLTQSWFNLQKASAALNRIDEIMNISSESTLHKGGLQKNDFHTSILFKNVTFRHKDQTNNTLENISLEIKKGQTIALVGKSGSGKSSLVDLLPRFYEANSGEISIDDINIQQIDLESLRKLFAIVTQEAILFHGSIEDNIRFGSKANEDQVKEASEISHSAEFITSSENGYKTSIGDRGQKLSGGQRQRLTLARALLRNAPVLILDEATSALDTESEKYIQLALDKVLPHMTAIVIAHRLNTIKKADLIVVLDEGKIVETGMHTELIAKNGFYKKMIELQN